MTIQQIIESVLRKTSYAWEEQDAIEAINSASRRVYNWIVKESPAKMFLKWDTSLTLSAASDEYQLPADLAQVIRIREYDAATGKWRRLNSAVDLNDMSATEAIASGASTIVGYADDVSPFKYYGPYEKGDGNFYIMIQPAADQDRPLEIIYDAAFIELVTKADYWMIPEDARDIVKDFAISELKEDNDDEGFTAREERAQKKLTEYLTLVRSRSLTDSYKKQEAYLD